MTTPKPTSAIPPMTAPENPDEVDGGDGGLTPA